MSRIPFVILRTDSDSDFEDKEKIGLFDFLPETLY
jgi:hypothetical protein